MILWHMLFLRCFTHHKNDFDTACLLQFETLIAALPTKESANLRKLFAQSCFSYQKELILLASRKVQDVDRRILAKEIREEVGAVPGICCSTPEVPVEACRSTAFAHP
jgi:hypothetical protein